MGCNADGLRGVGLYESSNFDGINVSMAGGGYINIAAQSTAFDGYALSNSLSFSTGDLSDGTLNLSLPRMSGKSRPESL